MRRFILNIYHPDGSLYWAQGFDRKNDLDKWLKTEEEKFYWKKTFRVEKIDNSVMLDQLEADLKAKSEELKIAEQAKLDKIKEDFKKKPKSVPELLALVELIAEHVGLQIKD